MFNEKSVPPTDITYICIISRGTIKKIKSKFIQGGEPSCRAKTVRARTKIELDG